MRPIPRRTHPRRRRLGAAALAFGGVPTKGSAEQRVTVGLIGAGGMGTNHLRLLAARKDVDVAYVCDVDRDPPGRGGDGRRERSGQGPQGGEGPAPRPRRPRRRRRLDRDARPLARAGGDPRLDAGKHVYVEKPCCHNIREGRLMVEAVGALGQAPPGRHPEPQHAPSSATRSSASAAGRSARCWWPRPGTASAAGSSARRSRREPPPQLDFDLWLGPAPMVPYQSNLLPGIWRWWYDFGSGDIGNDGVHDIDVARWGLGVDDPPQPGRLPGRQVLLRRRPAVPRHPVRRLRVPRRGGTGPGQAADLRAADLVALRAGGLRERRRVLRHRGDAGHRPHGRLEALRPAEQEDRGTDRPGRPGGAPSELPRLRPRRRRSRPTPT